MSDVEEPPAKVTRYEMSSQFLEGEVEEGQEEWLSEGILTDEDYNTTVEQDHTASLDTSQDGTMASVDNSIEHHTDSQETSFETTNPNISAENQISINEQNVNVVQNVSIVQNVSTDSPRLTVQIASGKIIIDGAGMVKKTVSNTHVTQDFEEALKNLEESQNSLSDLPEDLNAFLIRKKDGKIITSKLVDDKQSDIEDSPKHSDAEDDGNDTDGLLRVLGDDEENKKDEDSDDEFNLEGAEIKPVKVARNALISKNPATRAVLEDDDITDASSDEGEPVKKIFKATPKANPPKVNPPKTGGTKTTHVQAKPMETSTPLKTYVRKSLPRSKEPPKPAQSINTYSGPRKSLLGATVTNPTLLKKSTASLVKLPSAVNVTKVSTGSKEPPTKGPFHGIGTSKYNPKRSLLQPNATSISNPATKVNLEDAKVKTGVVKNQTEVAKVKTGVVKNQTEVAKVMTGVVKNQTEVAKVKTGVVKNQTEVAKVKTGVVKNQTEVAKVKMGVAKNQTEVAKVKTEVAKEKTEKQPIMKPEVMDDAMPSDMESESDEESLYDELPSSEDEGLNEWFTLDIRAERAGDYIPLLGDKAEKLLLEEKQRVASRLADLRKSLSALTETSRRQADQLSAASAELAELDAQIRAA